MEEFLNKKKTTLANLLQSVNPAEVGIKQALKRTLFLLAMVVAVVAVTAAVFEMMGLLAVVLFAVGATVLGTLPRWMATWFQYRSAFVEFGFSYACLVLLGGATAFKAIILIAGAAGAVSILKRWNVHYKDYHPVNNPKGSKNTLYETWLKKNNGSQDLPFWVTLMTSSDTSLRPDFVYDETQEGFLGWRVFFWSVCHSIQLTVFGGEEHDFFMETLPSGKVPWWRRVFMSNSRRFEASVQAVEELEQARQVLAVRAILARYRLEQAELIKIDELERNDGQHDRLYKLRTDIRKLTTRLKELAA